MAIIMQYYYERLLLLGNIYTILSGQFFEVDSKENGKKGHLTISILTNQ